jgi:hypothetical protein
MGTPQIIWKGLPCQFESCHGLAICEKSVASTKSSAYLIEPEEPSQLAAVSMPDGLELPSYRPSPAASTNDVPPELPEAGAVGWGECTGPGRCRGVGALAVAVTIGAGIEELALTWPWPRRAPRSGAVKVPLPVLPSRSASGVAAVLGK